MTSPPARYRIRHRVTVLAAALSLAVAGVAASAGTARAAFPGGNGKIYFQANGQLWSVNPDGTGAAQLTSSAFNQDAQVSPSGGKVAFVRYPGGTLSINVYTMNPDGSGVTQITTSGEADFNSLAWSPDGTRLVIGNFLTGALSIINADGSGQTSLGVTGQEPAWSPDGTEIAYTSCPAGVCNIYTVHPDGTGVTQVTSFGPSHLPFYASWSPDGSKLVFSLQVNAFPQVPDQIYTINADGTGLTDISNDTDYEFSPVWSPDGTKITYGDVSTSTLNIMNPDGSGKTPILSNSGVPQPSSWASLLTVTTTGLPGATLGSAYSATLTAAGGTPPYSWTVTSGALPPGLSLSPSGAISGTPAMAGTFPLTVQVSDSSSPAQTATASLSITVGAGSGGTTITGSHSGPLHIGPGVTVISGATLSGPVTIAAGAIVSITNSTLNGPLSAGVSVNGPASLAICGSTVTGPVSVSGASGPVLIGGGSGSPCAPDTIGGPVTLNSNTGGVTVAGNTISGSLSCSSNNPPPVDNGQPNKVGGSATGQCSTLI